MPLLIATQPNSHITTRPKHGFSIECEANSAGATYQWYKDGVKIDKATNKKYEVAEWSSEHDGWYQCFITEGNINLRTIKSLADTDMSAPVITISDVSIEPNANGIFDVDTKVQISITAETSDDVQGLTYKWSINSVPQPDHNSRTITVDHVTMEQAGNWSCEVKSGNASKIVNNAIKVQQVDYLRVSKEPVAANVPDKTKAEFTCEVLSNKPVNYQWVRQALGAGEWLTVYGANKPTLSLEYVTTAANNNDKYKCLITAGSMSVETAEVALTITDAIAITYTTQPTALTNVIPETNQKLEVVTSGEPNNYPTHYQWYKDNVAVPGATGKVLNFNGIEPADEGNYKIVALTGYNNELKFTSNSVAVTVNKTPSTITFNEQPKAANIGSGTRLYLAPRVSSSDNKKLRYSWYCNDKLLSKDMSYPSYFNPTPGPLDSGVYKCVAYTGKGEYLATKESTAVRIDVIDNLPAVITVAGSNLNAKSAKFNQRIKLNFTATTTGRELRFDWTKTVGTKVTHLDVDLPVLEFYADETANYGCKVYSDGVVKDVGSSTITVATHDKVKSVDPSTNHVVTATTGKCELEAGVELVTSTDLVTYQWKKKNEAGTFQNVAGATSKKYEATGPAEGKIDEYICVMTVGGQEVHSSIYKVYATTANKYDYYVHPLPHRNTSFMYVNYWVLDEIKAYEGHNWIALYDHMQYKDEVETIISAIKDHGSSLILESRDGRILSSDLML